VLPNIKVLSVILESGETVKIDGSQYPTLELVRTTPNTYTHANFKAIMNSCGATLLAPPYYTDRESRLKDDIIARVAEMRGTNVACYIPYVGKQVPRNFDVEWCQSQLPLIALNGQTRDIQNKARYFMGRGNPKAGLGSLQDMTGQRAPISMIYFP
jgi:hypothetical protein